MHCKNRGSGEVTGGVIALVCVVVLLVNKLEFRRKNELIIQDLERQLRPCPFCHTSVELSCLTDDYFFPDLESGECHPYISATFFIRCKRHCVEFRRHFDFKFKDNDDFSDYIGPVELVKEWNGE